MSSSPGIIELDHLMVSVRSSQEAGDTFARLGFAVTPKSDVSGLSNRLVCFPCPAPGTCNFVELLALEDLERVPPPIPRILLPPERPVAMVMASLDGRATRRALQERGLRTSPPLDFQRDWVLPSGEVTTPAFTVVVPEPGQAPLYWSVCQHKTPGLYERPEFVSHGNGARAATAILAQVEDPEAVGRYFQDAWHARLEPFEGRLDVVTGTVRLELYGPDAARRHLLGGAAEGGDRLLGFAVRGGDGWAGLERRLEAHGFETVRQGARLLVAPAQTHGCLVTFEMC